MTVRTPFFLLAWALLGLAVLAAAPAHILRPFRDADMLSWRAITQSALTPDGQWFIYALVPDASIPPMIGPPAAGESSVIVRNVRSGAERYYSAKEGSGAFQISPDGRYFGFVRKVGASRFVIIGDIISGASWEIGTAAEFSFAGNMGDRLVLQDLASDDAGGLVTICDLKGRPLHRFEAVRSCMLDPTGSWLILQSSRGVFAWHMIQDRALGVPLEASATLSQWCWSPSGNALVARVDEPGRPPGIVCVSGWADSMPTTKSYAKQLATVLPAGATVTGGFNWRADETSVFFTFRRARLGTSTSANGQVAIWHSRAPLLPAEVIAAERSASQNDFGILSLVDGRVTTLGNETLQGIQLRTKGRWLLGYDRSAYGWRGTDTERAQRRDYDLVDLETGNRTALVRDLTVVTRGGNFTGPLFSPDGNTLVWRDNAGEFVACDLATRIVRPLTAHLSVRFFHSEDRPGNLTEMWDRERNAGVQAWVPENDAVLISDGFDLWELPLHEGHARNLTEGRGRKRGVHYSVSALSLPASHALGSVPNVFAQVFALRAGEAFLSPAQPWFFSTYEFSTAREGLATLDMQTGEWRDLLSEPATLSFLRSSNGETVLESRGTSADCPNYYQLDEHWQPQQRLTDANPQQREFEWPEAARYLTYQTVGGAVSHTALYLPSGYRVGQHCPAIVYLYHRVANTVNQYSPFEWLLYPWLQSGYAVMKVDVTPRLDEPGPAAVEFLKAGIDAAVATGTVDRDRIGLRGHSYGGYETYYIATRTTLVKAASPYAGLSNLWSHEASSYGVDGSPMLAMGETKQPYLGQPWWNHWAATIENSPLAFVADLKTPMLIAHGTRDREVRFAQAEEFFNGARFAGNPSVVLLEYPNEGHDFSPVAARDYHQRCLQFFGHFLKDEPLPDWWANGRSYPAGSLPGDKPREPAATVR